jgi:queuine tRNA-ribosyltransferase
MSFFKIEFKSTDSHARAGLLHTNHGIIKTPVFMPVGTQGTVKAIEQRTLKNLGYRLILGNAYHLYLRPGVEVISGFGGLHNFINWNGAILTDSGGYQIFSINELRKLSDDGVEFKSHIDGSKHFFTPENVIEIQRKLGSDIIMVLDECTPYPCSLEFANKSMELSLSWAKRSKIAYIKSNNDSLSGYNQFLFGIGQGSIYPELRKKYLENLIEIDFDGYAIGGLSVGEPSDILYEITEVSTLIIPEEKPRYLMGVGTPENILNAIESGIDMFDCVLPTRNARNGQLFTTRGKINIKNAKYKFYDKPIDEKIDNFVSRNYPLAYLRHLFLSGEILGIMLATEHNLAFYHWLVSNARNKILDGNYRQWKNDLLKQISNNEYTD